MKKLLLAAAIVAGSCSLVMAQGGTGTTGAESSGGQGSQGTSSAPALQKQGTASDRMAKRPVKMMKKKKKRATSM